MEFANQVLPQQPSKLLKEDTNKSSTDRQFSVFAMGWAFSALFHIARDRDYAATFDFAVLTLSAFLVIGKPSSVKRFLLLLVAQATVSIRILPGVSNHEMFALLVNLGMLHATVFYLLKTKSFHIDKGNLYDTFAPVVRIGLIILYFFAVFHKLNSSFFNPEFSCGKYFWLKQPPYELLPQSNLIYLLNAFVTIGAEFLIGALLCFRKTRKVGLFIGIFFHFVIAYNQESGFYDFSSVLYACYLAFMDRRFGDKAYELGLRIQAYFTNLSAVSFSAAKVVFLFLAGILIIVGVPAIAKYVPDYFRYICWTIFGLIFIYIFAKAYLTGDNKTAISQIRFKPVHASLLLLPALLFFNGWCPYLGLKTETSFSMFSNLRTEAGISNHYIIPASMQVFDYQRDMVEVISSTEPRLQRVAEREQLMPYFHFKNLVSRTRPERVEYLRQGKSYVFDLKNVSENDNLLVGNPFLLRKIMNFRTVNKNLPQPCGH